MHRRRGPKNGVCCRLAGCCSLLPGEVASEGGQMEPQRIAGCNLQEQEQEQEQRGRVVRSKVNDVNICVRSNVTKIMGVVH